MTRRDYVAIAKGVREAPIALSWPSLVEGRDDEEEIRGTVAESLADVLALTNPRFDRERFIAACLGEP